MAIIVLIVALFCSYYTMKNGFWTTMAYFSNNSIESSKYMNKTVNKAVQQCKFGVLAFHIVYSGMCILRCSLYIVACIFLYYVCLNQAYPITLMCALLSVVVMDCVVLLAQCKALARLYNPRIGFRPYLLWWGLYKKDNRYQLLASSVAHMLVGFFAFVIGCGIIWK